MQKKQEVEEKAGETDELADDSGADVKGFIFSKLAERRPHLKPDLLTFRDALLAADSREDTLKVGFRVLCIGEAGSADHAGSGVWVRV
jgi:hypothetical protein